MTTWWTWTMVIFLWSLGIHSLANAVDRNSITAFVTMYICLMSLLVALVLLTINFICYMGAWPCVPQ